MAMENIKGAETYGPYPMAINTSEFIMSTIIDQLDAIDNDVYLSLT